MRLLSSFFLLAACSGTPSVDIPVSGETDGGSTSQPSGPCDPKMCPGVDGPCGERVCEAGACAMRFAPSGATVSEQVTGDCKRAQCDGAGKVATVADDTDVPNDNNVCTADRCNSGKPEFSNVAAGTKCGALVCDGAGACGGCTTASECPGVDDGCKLRACVAGKCGFAFTPAGTSSPTQTAGDCKRALCDGSGNLQSVNDDSDAPNDGNACTAETCVAGVPKSTPLPTGTGCVGGSCNAAGMCVAECNVASECPGTDTFCSKRACVANRCVPNNTPIGTPTPNQVAQDCKRRECDGAGGVVNVPFDIDIDFDDNTCTRDICVGGMARHPPEPAGLPCNARGGKKCDGAGMCVP